MGDAYEIGYNHGMNVFRRMIGRPPVDVERGWVLINDAVIGVVELYIKTNYEEAKERVQVHGGTRRKRKVTPQEKRFKGKAKTKRGGR